MITGALHDSISRFIGKQTCASICCVDEDGRPHCFACFYAFEKDNALLYFKSSAASRHMTILKKKPFVSGTILPDRLRTYAIEGIQFHGLWLPQDHPLAQKAPERYHIKYPFALVIAGEVHTIQLQATRMSKKIKV